MAFVLRGEDDIVFARQRAREVARGLGFGDLDQSRIATAVSELTRNVVADEGPGIADLEAAFREGFTSGAGIGLGLPGTRRLMDEMELTSSSPRGGEDTLTAVREKAPPEHRNSAHSKRRGSPRRADMGIRLSHSGPAVLQRSGTRAIPDGWLAPSRSSPDC